MVGDGAPMLVRRRAQAVAASIRRRQEALARYLQIYDRRLMNHTVPYDGVVESLAVIACGAGRSRC